MLKAITLRNVQSHRKTRLVLDPGINIVVGSSDSGKSAIRRALRWVVENRPIGDGLRSHWGGKTRVGITTTDGHTIIRVRGKKRNGYLVDGTALVALKGSVPSAVEEALRLRPINFQTQTDPPFLLSNSPGEIAKTFNDVVGLQRVDLALATAGSWKRSLSSDQEQEERERDKLIYNLRETLWTKEARIDIGQLWDKYTSAKTLLSREQTLRSLREDLDKTDRVLANLQSRFEEMESSATKLLDKNDRYFISAQIAQLVEKALEQEQRVVVARQTYLTLCKQMPEVCPTCGSVLNKKG